MLSYMGNMHVQYNVVIFNKCCNLSSNLINVELPSVLLPFISLSDTFNCLSSL